MVDSLIRNMGEAFWEAAADTGPFPRELERAVAWAAPLGILRIPNLWVGDIKACLTQRQLPFFIGVEDRPLHGCVCAYGGRGLIFVNGTDEPAEARFTVAHELAHYLLDYERPRRSAIEKLGSDITAVLDGLRPIKREERVDALLAGVRIGFYSHFMHRENDQCVTDVADSETRADRLALELLAPEDQVRDALPRGFFRKPYTKRTGSVRRILKMRFDLPTSVAHGYAAHLCRDWFHRPSAREWLGVK
jgi:hypothetical protein